MIEHSSIDVWISQWLYRGNGTWLIDKGAWLPDLLFYTGIKRLLILLEVYILLAWLQRLFTKYRPQPKSSQPSAFFCPINHLSSMEVGYLTVVMLLIPTLVATLKALTHVSCPNHLQLFSGNLPFLSLWQDITSNNPDKCFPAAHASSGFALYAWAFLPNLYRYRWRIIAGVTLLAWLMGLYKMAIGDHFFSHTMISMCLA